MPGFHHRKRCQFWRGNGLFQFQARRGGAADDGWRRLVETGRNKLGAVIGDHVRFGANTVVLPGRVVSPEHGPCPAKFSGRTVFRNRTHGLPVNGGILSGNPQSFLFHSKISGMSTDEKVFTTLYLSVSCICENFCPKTLLKLHFQCSGEPEMPETHGLWNRLLRMLK